ncbi:hypothetical protein JCM8097_006034 [Rhodosporidiobolus ruineniae]
MAKASKGGFYAVRAGHQPGVYTSWPDAERQVKGFNAAKHKKFPTRAEAEAYVAGNDSPRPAGAGGTQTKLAPSGVPSKTSASRTRPAPSTDEPPTKRQRVDPVFGGEGKKAKGRVVYCDGSSRGNGKKGAVAGIGVFWGHEVGAKNLSERLPGPLQTNNRAEMYAVARILETDPTPDLPLTICSDSEYTIGVFSKWISGWKRRNWRTADGKPVANQDLIRYILSLLALRTPPPASTSSYGSPPSSLANITFHKVKAHVGIEGNEQADRFANNGAMMPEVEDRDFAADTKANERKLKERRGAKASVEDVQWDVELEEGDLLDEDELRELERTQDF